MIHLKRLFLISYALLTSSSAWATAGGELSLKVTSPAGSFIGSKLDDAVQYLGIPYAQPPVGPLRWQSPKALAPIREFNANQFGPACAQSAKSESKPGASLGSEDCLYLNVWTPKLAARDFKTLPVVVWIHGGGFRAGSASLPEYNGRNFAAKGVIFVSINYRLGRLGFFAHPALNNSKDFSGNFGLLDQLKALSWVKENIESFGGDHSNITVMGESAGGASILYLMQSAAGRGLINKAIVQSGAIDLPEYSKTEMEDFAKVAVTKWGLKSANANQLRRVKLEDILAEKIQKPEAMPYIDQTLIKEKMLMSFASGDFARIPLLIGSNSYEAGFFPLSFSQRVPAKLGAEIWKRASSLTDGYGKNIESLKEAQVASDLFVTVGTVKISRLIAKSAPVYRYWFSFVPERLTSQPGAIHTAEIQYVFGNPGTLAWDKNEKSLSDEMQSRWVEFAKSASPNNKSLSLVWKPFVDGKNGDVLQFGVGPGIGQSQLVNEPNQKRIEYLMTLPSMGIN